MNSRQQDINRQIAEYLVREMTPEERYTKMLALGPCAVGGTMNSRQQDINRQIAERRGGEYETSTDRHGLLRPRG
mgnify:CR=1 FL=1